MREVKFRAFIKKLGWVVAVEQINFNVETVEVDLSSGQGDTAEYNFDEIELMQYTGLKDFGGIEIWEGDIIENTRKNIGVVKFHDWNSGFFFCMKLKYSDKRYGQCSGAQTFDRDSYKYLILGNIYENPELLKEGR